MILNPVAGNESFEKQFEHIGINLTYGFDAGKLAPETIAGLNRAAKDAFAIITNAQEELNPRISNGWMTGLLQFSLTPEIGGSKIKTQRSRKKWETKRCTTEASRKKR